MVELTEREKELLDRYLRLTHKHDRYVLFERSRHASNDVLDAVEAAIREKDLTDYHLIYLQGINRRRSKNFRKLVGIDGLLRVTAALRAKTLEDLGLGNRA